MPYQFIGIVETVGPAKSHERTWTREVPLACHPTWDLEDYLPM